jgi:hypothetical protein
MSAAIPSAGGRFLSEALRLFQNIALFARREDVSGEEGVNY